MSKKFTEVETVEEMHEAPEGTQRLAKISVEDLGRIMAVIPEELTVPDAAEIIVNILINYGMEEQLHDVMALTHYALDENSEAVSIGIPLEAVDLKKGGH